MKVSLSKCLVVLFALVVVSAIADAQKISSTKSPTPKDSTKKPGPTKKAAPTGAVSTPYPTRTPIHKKPLGEILRKIKKKVGCGMPEQFMHEIIPLYKGKEVLFTNSLPKLPMQGDHKRVSKSFCDHSVHAFSNQTHLILEVVSHTEHVPKRGKITTKVPREIPLDEGL